MVVTCYLLFSLLFSLIPSFVTCFYRLCMCLFSCFSYLVFSFLLFFVISFILDFLKFLLYSFHLVHPPSSHISPSVHFIFQFSLTSFTVETYPKFSPFFHFLSLPLYPSHLLQNHSTLNTYSNSQQISDTPVRMLLFHSLSLHSTPLNSTLPLQQTQTGKDWGRHNDTPDKRTRLLRSP